MKWEIETNKKNYLKTIARAERKRVPKIVFLVWYKDV